MEFCYFYHPGGLKPKRMKKKETFIETNTLRVSSALE